MIFFLEVFSVVELGYMGVEVFVFRLVRFEYLRSLIFIDFIFFVSGK